MFAAEAVTLALAVATAAPASDAFERTFDVAEPGEVVATVRAGCGRCAWGEPGREAAALRIIVDGRYSQHLLLARGETAVDYRVTLGALPAGRHRLSVRRDPALSARGAGPARIAVDAFTVMADGGDEAIAQSLAPILYARPNTVGKFTDLPILMWYEVVPTSRGRQFRYSVIFTNEDGGTATDRLMATWGRTTDIEFVYGAELDADGGLVAEQFQGPGHEVPPFKGRHEGRHPLLWVSTDNNMVSESGPTTVRYAPAPERFDLANASREVVMDRHPWSYALAAQEMAREGKIAADPPPNSNTIPDPRRYVVVEACGEVGSAALAVAVGVRRAGRVPRQAGGDLDWIPSDRGVPQFRIVRDGCFRAATPLPAGTGPGDIAGLRVLAFERPAAAGRPPLPSRPIRLTRINTMFMLDQQYLPRPSMLQPWRGDVTLGAGDPPFELGVP